MFCLFVLNMVVSIKPFRHIGTQVRVCRHTQTHTHPYVSTYMSADLSLTLENSANFYHPLS